MDLLILLFTIVYGFIGFIIAIITVTANRDSYPAWFLFIVFILATLFWPVVLAMVWDAVKELKDKENCDR